jgi:DNA-binding NarL/FixJ family response regulator
MLGCIDVSQRRATRTVIRILLADDSILVIDRITELLRDVEGIELAGRAGDIREASRMIVELQPDVVILDLQMSDGNAMRVLGAIKGNCREPVVILLTNSSAVAIRERCLKTGADFFLDKSNELERLPQIVKEIAETTQTAPKTTVQSPQPPYAKPAL